jgi:hypothetical protein
MLAVTPVILALVVVACDGDDDDDNDNNNDNDAGDDDDNNDNDNDDAGAPQPYTPCCDVDPAPIALDDPGLPAGGDGPFQFVVIEHTLVDEVRDREISADIYLPSEDGDTPADEGAPYPLVLAVHGFSGNKAMMREHGERLASWGYIAVAPTLPYFNPLQILKMSHVESAKDLLFVLDSLCCLSQESGNPLAGRVDRSRLASVAHSAGGKISVLASTYDGGLLAVAGLDPVDGAGPFDWSDDPDFPNVTPDLVQDLLIPTLYLGSEKGGIEVLGQACAPVEYNYHQFWTYSPPPSVEILFLGADHTDFVTMPPVPDPCNIGTADPAVVKRLAKKYAVAFLNYHLRGWERFEAVFAGAGVDADEDAGLVTWREK